MNFIFSWQKTIFYSLAALVCKILFCHSKIKFISSRPCVISSIYQNLLIFLVINNYISFIDKSLLSLNCHKDRKIQDPILPDFKTNSFLHAGFLLYLLTDQTIFFRMAALKSLVLISRRPTCDVVAGYN